MELVFVYSWVCCMRFGCQSQCIRRYSSRAIINSMLLNLAEVNVGSYCVYVIWSKTETCMQDTGHVGFGTVVFAGTIPSEDRVMKDSVILQYIQRVLRIWFSRLESIHLVFPKCVCNRIAILEV